MAKLGGRVYDSAGQPAVGRVVRAYRRDTGELLGSATTSDGVTQQPTEYTQVAGESGSFTVAAGQTVRYGAGDNWFERTFTSDGTHGCDTTTFGGDPAQGTLKTCQLVHTPPVLPIGQYSITTGTFTGEVNVVCLDDTAGSYENDLILRTTPVSPSLGEVYSGLVLWIDPSDTSTVTVVDGKISQINDKSTSAKIISQTAVDEQPFADMTTFGIRGMDFSSSGRMVFDSALALPVTHTLFMVFSGPAGGSLYGFIGLTNRASSVQIGTDLFGATTSSSGSYWSPQMGHGSTSAYTDGRFSIDKAVLAAVINGVPEEARLRLDGAELSVIYSSLSDEMALDLLGSRAGDMFASRGVLGEIVAYDRVLTAEEIAAVETYLKNKWGTP